MPKKRKSRGRGKGGKGRSSMVQCVICGTLVPRDKAKKKIATVSIIGGSLGRELREKGAYLPRTKRVKYYCISCAVHRGISSPRQKEKRLLSRSQERRLRERKTMPKGIRKY